MLGNELNSCGRTPFYLPDHGSVDQIAQRMRWAAEPQPKADQFKKGAL